MPPTRTVALLLATLCTLAATAPARAVTATGRLQVVHLDIGQGDGAVIISPLGEVAMIDNGPGGTGATGQTMAQQCQALGITRIKHVFSSHYHSDHLGAIDELGPAGITFDYAWDRGSSYSSSYYTTYVTVTGAKRRTLAKDQVITLDSLSAHPVRIKCVNLNAAGISTTDENSLSIQLKVSYGEFDESFGGDTPGANSGSYKNVETTVGPQMGVVEVYKVHHHGSATSSYTDWMNATRPKIGIISCGNGNSYGHPTSSALSRLHAAGTHTYWTETGAGATPLAGWDRAVNGPITISATWEPGGVDTVRGSGFADTFTNSGTPAGDTVSPLATLLSPDGGETWKAGSSHQVTWNASDNTGVTTVDLAWSGDGGASFPNAIANGVPNSGAWWWTVPDTVTGVARVRVTARDAAGNLGRDSSLAVFTIDRWTIAASAGTGGTISPSGTVGVSEGGSQAFAIASEGGWALADVVVDGVSVGPVAEYSFTGVAADHTIAASFSSVAGVPAGPARLALARPAPNPARGSALLRFSLPQAGRARLEVLDLTGRRVLAAEGEWPAGWSAVRWDDPAGAGLYFVRLTTPWGVRAERIVRLR